MSVVTSYDFLKSALDDSSIDEALKWVENQNERVEVKIDKVDFNRLDQWSFDDKDGRLKHNSGSFFSLDGIRIKTNWGEINQWDQPIINQAEVGFLGFIVKKINGVYHFLTQAKVEPGNINFVQLSPTLQATRSNYQQIHKGRAPLYLEYFQNAPNDQVLLDQLQSEQGARFLKKRNRNIIIEIKEDIHVHDNFIWLTLGQLKRLMRLDNIVNMDTRTVISGINFGNFNEQTLRLLDLVDQSKKYNSSFLKSTLVTDKSLHSISNIITFMTELKSMTDLDVQKISLAKMNDWIIKPNEIVRRDKKYFKVVGVQVEIDNREVSRWSQPMVEPMNDGLCAFVCKEIGGILHLAVQAKLECGNLDIIEFAPTVQTLTGDYKSRSSKCLPFLDYVLNIESEKIYFDTLQSEEGGRFYKEQNRNMIVMAGDEVAIDLPPNFIWMTLNQMYIFLRFNNYLNIQARNLIAAISF